MKMKWILIFVACLFAVRAKATEIRNVTATYNWPWDVVGISYEVLGELPVDAWLVVTATDRANNTSYTALENALSGDMSRNVGAHRVIWDVNKQGISLESTNVVFTVEYKKTPLYCVLDLSGGVNATSYPVTWLDEPPNGGFNNSEYQTTKLVLRRIEPGTFMMGAPDEELGRSGNETQHQVTLTNLFYIGLFEVTQKQWESVMEVETWRYGIGSGVTVISTHQSYYLGDRRPVEHVSYNDIRGTVAGTNWPASNAVDADSFLGKLRARTGLPFDLPTEAQWEYACRAGTTTALNSGRNLATQTNCPNMTAVGRYRFNCNDKHGEYEHTRVGSYQPNAWGLYDMHGNVSEWCLDWYAAYDTEHAINPPGASTGHFRVCRGGNWGVDAAACRSAYRSEVRQPGYAYDKWGFRLSLPGGFPYPPERASQQSDIRGNNGRNEGISMNIQE